jgi:hypothetical protein
MRRTDRRRPVLRGAALVAALTTLAGVAAAADPSAPSPSPPAVPQDHAAPLVATPDGAQLAALGILGRAAQPDDALPEAARAHLARGATPDLGANPALARHALTTSLGEGLYVVPGRGWVCLASSTGAATCTPTDRIAAGYAVMLQEIPSGWRLSGLLPDGVARVEVRGAAGETATATASGNAWRADVAFAPARVAWTADGAAETSVPVLGPAPAPVAG